MKNNKESSQSAVVFIKNSDKKVYQVALNKYEVNVLLAFLEQIHGGKVKCLDKDFSDTVSWETKKE